jgi:DNA polymerase
VSQLTEIAEAIRECTACLLHRGRTQAVPGSGPEDAQIVFIGEAPGFHEDQQAIPFVGAAGKFLDQLLAEIDLDREKVFITNIIKCRPPANRDPLPDEIEACTPHLERQLETLNPKLVITLGRFSMARYFPKARISQIHGQPRRVGNVICLPMYHPAAALHQPSLRAVVKEDFLRIPELLEQVDQISDYEPPPEAEQLRLF